MAKSKIPNALEMRDLKYGDRTDAERDALAITLREADRRSEALLLFEGRPDAPFLREERVWAEEQGAAFHLRSLDLMGVEIPPASWQACAATAERRERWMDARTCYEALGDDEAIAKIAEHLPPSLRPASEEEATAED